MKREFLTKIAVFVLSGMMIIPVTSVLNSDVTVKADVMSDDSALPEGAVLNYHEMEPWDTSFSDEEIFDIPCVYGTLPTSYSSSSKISDGMTVSSKKDYVTGVKYQSGGTCWAHTATSIAESSYIKNEGITSIDDIDFNEYHLVHYTYHSPADSMGLFGGDTTENISGYDDLNAGGNVENSLCNYANWIGASDDTDFTSSDVAGNHSNVLAFEDAAHLENGYVLSMPDMTSDTYLNDMNVIKQMIMDYGSVSVSYYSGNSNYYANGYQYCDTDVSTNHAVTIVGWDDSISASSFLKTPAGDGAWLVKNSWGTSWGLNGYFWLSYYDKSISENSVAFDFANSDNYDNNYQYDGSGNVWGSTFGYMNQTAAANAFVADSPESLEAVGFYTYYNNMNYEIQIYRNLEEGALPQTGELVLTQTGSETYAGFHTVELSEFISLKENERYAIVITWKKEGEYIFIRADKTKAYSWISFTSYAKAGESYWGRNVNSLSDLNADNTDYADGVNVRIKAFTNEIEVVETTGIFMNKTSASIASGATLQLVATTLPTNATYQGVTYSSKDPTLATVDEKGLVTANTTGKAGTTTITATSEYGNKTAVCNVTVEPVTVTGITLDKTTASLKPGEIIVVTATVTPANATNQGVSWSSSDTKIATVDQNGKVTALSEGSVTITATAADGSGSKASCGISVVHDWNTSYTVDKAATCSEEGSKSIHCKNCSATKDSRTIAKIAHSWDDGTVTKEPTCTATGILTRHCINCTATTTESIAANGHDWNTTYTVDKAATCSEEGSKSIHCKNCSTTKDSRTIAKIAHSWDDGTVTKEPTCTTTGGLTRHCNNCTAMQTETIAKTAHNWNSTYTVDKSATYTEEGSKSIHCRNCSAKKDIRAISALNGLAPENNGVRNYYENGKIKSTMTTLLKNNGIWYYVQKGVVSGKYSGLVKYNGSWFYVKNSKVDFGYTGLCKYNGSWFYVEKGVLNWNYTGLCKYSGSWFYIQKGVINWNYTGLCKYNGSWFYVKGGVVNFGYTGLCKYGSNWYYVKGGVLNWNYTGLCKNGSSWYYIKGGVLNWNYTGLCKYSSSWYYVKSGVLNWNYTGLCKYGSKWYYVQKGVVNFKYTGYTNYSGLRWYVKNGVMVKKAF